MRKVPILYAEIAGARLKLLAGNFMQPAAPPIRPFAFCGLTTITTSWPNATRNRSKRPTENWPMDPGIRHYRIHTTHCAVIPEEGVFCGTQNVSPLSGSPLGALATLIECGIPNRSLNICCANAGRVWYEGRERCVNLIAAFAGGDMNRGAIKFQCLKLPLVPLAAYPRLRCQPPQGGLA